MKNHSKMMVNPKSRSIAKSGGKKMEVLKGQEALQALVGVLPHIVKSLPEDMALYVTDGEKYLQAVEGSDLPIGITVGSKVWGKATERCMVEKRKTTFNVRDGMPFKGVNIPILDENNNSVGTIICATGRKKQQDVNQVAEQLADTLDQMAGAMNEIASGAARLAEVGQALTEKAQLSDKKIAETEVIINSIKSISNQTNLLGLNAAIESARAGEYGRGFGVVAQEIRKLADESKHSTEQVKVIIEAISSAVKTMSLSAEESGAISQQQAAAIQENTATIDELRNVGLKLKDFAAKL